MLPTVRMERLTWHDLKPRKVNKVTSLMSVIIFMQPNHKTGQFTGVFTCLVGSLIDLSDITQPS